MDKYKFKVKRLGKVTEVKVRFSPCAFPSTNGDLQGATTCVLQISGNIYAGTALLHPKENAEDWTGKRTALDRAINSFLVEAPKEKRKDAKKSLWDAFMKTKKKQEEGV